jgi:hypothetical protein
MKSAIFGCLSALIALFLLAPREAPAHAHPLGNTLLDWHKDPNIARVSAMNIDFHGGDYFVTWRAPGRIEEVDGRQCLVGGYFFFDVNDRFAFDIDETVTLELEFDRSRTDGFNLSYDHAVNPTAKKVRLSPDYKERWERVTIDLERARFANRKYEHMDFAIGALGAMQPQPTGVNGELVLCDMKISRRSSAPKAAEPIGKLRLQVLNEDGESDTARVGLYRADGYSPLPGDDAVSVVPFEAELKQWPLLYSVRGWPSKGRYVFYVDGSYQADVPEGQYTLVVFKGPEYRIATRQVEVRRSMTSNVAVKLERWTDMPRRGWYSGDGHIHIARPTPAENDRIIAYTSAEDIHVSNLLQVSSVGQKASYPQYAFGRAGDFLQDQHSLVSGQESPRSSHRGHTIGLNVPEYIWTDDGYFVYDRIARRIAERGGLFGYAHVAIDAFNVQYGLAVDVPLGDVDFLEVLQMGFLNTAYLYDFLNLGFKLLPSAGSDYPFIRTAGSERVYVKVGDDFSPAAWFDAYVKNRSFVSSGPNIEFAVNGDADAVEFEFRNGDTVEIRTKASVNPDIDLISKLELVIQGEVVKSVSSEAGAESLALEYRMKPLQAVWMAVRAYGTEHSAAHTAPVYFYVDDSKQFWKKAVVPTIAAKYIETLLEFKASSPNLDEDWERSETEHSLHSQWNRDKAGLDQSIDRAIVKYRDLIKEAE